MGNNKKQVIENIKNQIETFESEIEVLKKKLEKARTFKYKMGQAVEHKDKGASIISGLSVEVVKEGSIFKGEKTRIIKKYDILTLGGNLQAEEDELIPLSALTKQLYGKDEK